MSVDRDNLISALITIRDNGYIEDDAFKRQEHMALMLESIGDPDPFIRDELIYTNMYEWIEARDYFDEEQLKQILSVLIDDKHLFLDIGSDGTGSVFTRSFSALGVALVLSRHRLKPVFSAGEFKGIKDRAILYYTSEKDLRGYTIESGWAHCAAHGADVMGELAQCEECGEEAAMEIMAAFIKVLYNGKYAFHDEEDERIARVVFRMIKDNTLPRRDIKKWLDDLCECMEWERDRNQDIARVNAKNLCRCLYFKLMHWDETPGFIDSVFSAEERLNRFLIVDKELIEA